MEIQNIDTKPRESNQLQNINTVRWKSGNVTTQQTDNDYRKSEVIAFVLNAGTNVTAKQ